MSSFTNIISFCVSHPITEHLLSGMLFRGHDWAKLHAQGDIFSYFFGRILDFNPNSTKPKLLLLISTSGLTRGISFLRFAAGIATNTIFILKKLYNVEYRRVSTIEDICHAISNSHPNDLFIDAHANSQSLSIGEGIFLTKDTIPMNCFNNITRIFLQCCHAGQGNQSIAQEISKRTTAHVFASDSAVLSYFLPDKNSGIFFPGPWFSNTRTFANNQLVNETASFPFLAYFIPNCLINAFLFANEVSLLLQAAASILKISPHLSEITFSLSEHTVIKPLLYCSSLCKLKNSARERILSAFQKTEKWTRNFFSFSAQCIAPKMRKVAAKINSIFIFPLISLPFKMCDSLAFFWHTALEHLSTKILSKKIIHLLQAPSQTISKICNAFQNHFFFDLRLDETN